MTAKEMFERLGYKLFLNDNENLIYRKKNDFLDNSVTFYLGNKFPMCYDISFIDWKDDKKEGWIPMSEREENLKHCATYGHWQKVNYAINLSLHKAINKQVKELGW